MKKVLVTGGSGLVGRCIEGDVKISSKDADLTNFDQTKKIFDYHNPTHVIHTAAKVGGVGYNMSNNAQFFYDNITMNSNILEICRLNNVTKLVSLLSTCIFPDKIEYPLDEKKIHLGPPHPSNEGYAYAKRMLDIQSKLYSNQYDLNYICVIPTNVYGIGDNFDLKNGHVIPSLIHKCYLSKQNNTDFVIWGSGKPLREFIYNKDLSKLIEWSLDFYDETEPIIFSPSYEISIKDISILIADAFNFKGKIIFDNTKPDGQFRKPSSNEKLKKYLPEFEFTNIDTGIKETVDWFINNYENIRK